ncbi:TPA: hypothetical protein L3V69_003088 [Vibrio parahaemolyticus]|uniref:hypothetical protein n=1 Tax=Vibrio parahaemolyticus TaxID=670 RepID=UPI00046FA372|nr:hypothetical protein [Vibrio parahaemolyticus]EGQ8248655.1 hypothetical protein [Vibrio parahaemolyticus]EGQ8932540.1 hypothetical protein [Vibrio parahaemolyticus]EGQ8977184.1 hypothetical protein [Vibrio parahaemolyticus]EGQ8982036.1 hypothetical protein [Vibrio parahaemolyticus]EGQ9000908.1 hypothetical protein [Vibrio parahaemolyticus]
MDNFSFFSNEILSVLAIFATVFCALCAYFTLKRDDKSKKRKLKFSHKFGENNSFYIHIKNESNLPVDIVSLYYYSNKINENKDVELIEPIVVKPHRTTKFLLDLREEGYFLDGVDRFVFSTVDGSFVFKLPMCFGDLVNAECSNLNRRWGALIKSVKK